MDVLNILFGAPVFCMKLMYFLRYYLINKTSILNMISCLMLGKCLHADIYGQLELNGKLGKRLQPPYVCNVSVCLANVCLCLPPWN